MARRGRRAGIVLLVLLLLLIGVVVAADRIGATVAANRIAEQATKEMQARGMTSPSKPAVSIGGFPFLTQVASGVYQKITIDVDQPRTQQVKLDHLTLVASNVRASASDLLNGRGNVVADQLTGTATMGWDAVKSLVQLAGLPSSVDPAQLQVRVTDNNVELRLPLSVAGFTVTLRATGTLTVADGAVRVRLTDLVAEGTDSALISRTVSALRDRLTATIRIPQMPYKLVIKKAETTSAGLLITAVADNVKLVG